MFYQQQQQQPGGSIRIEWQTAIVSENKPNLPPSSTSEPPSHSLAPLFEDTGCFSVVKNIYRILKQYFTTQQHLQAGLPGVYSLNRKYSALDLLPHGAQYSIGFWVNHCLIFVRNYFLNILNIHLVAVEVDFESTFAELNFRTRVRNLKSDGSGPASMC